MCDELHAMCHRDILFLLNFTQFCGMLVTVTFWANETRDFVWPEFYKTHKYNSYTEYNLCFRSHIQSFTQIVHQMWKVEIYLRPSVEGGFFKGTI
jgi:hypothetical protein